MAPKNPDLSCKAQTKSGKRCSAAVTEGGLCFFHTNPNKAAELGRIGGRCKQQATAKGCDLLPRLDTATAVKEALGRLIPDVLSGKLHPRVAASVAPLLNLQIRVIEASDLEHRVSKLEQLLAEAEVESDEGSGGRPFPRASNQRGEPCKAARHVAR